MTAVDNCDTNPTILPISSIRGFCPSIIEREWIAFDRCGNTNRAFQTILINDTLAPVVRCPSNIVRCTPNVTFTATASDNCDTNPTVTCTRSDGLPLAALYPLGTTLITCRAIDSCTNFCIPCTFTITIATNTTIIGPTAT